MPPLMPNAPRIHVTPEDGPVDGDGALAIVLSGFPARREVTLRASLEDPGRRPWTSHAVFTTDDSGAVDLALSPPLSGSYAGADVEGLWWSLAPEGPAPRAPFDESNLAPLEVTFRAELDGEPAPLATAVARRHWLADGCQATTITEDGLRGTLFRPTQQSAAAGNGPFPPALILGGSAGGQTFSAQCAALLARHGYASLALSYFADEGLPGHLVGIPLEYFGRALAWLRAQPWARSDGVAVIGRSRGGELALLLGATFPEVRAVVAYCPSDRLWGGIRNNQLLDEAAWSHHGRPLPHVTPRLTPDQQKAIFGTRPVSLRPLFEHPVDPEAARLATIPVERINGPVLIFSGDDDRMWPAGRMCDAVIERLAEHRHPHPFAHHCYPGAGHLLRAPSLPTSVLDSPTFALGGAAHGQALANRHSWTELLRALAGPSALARLDHARPA